jgi:hypothetical protein
VQSQTDPGYTLHRGTPLEPAKSFRLEEKRFERQSLSRALQDKPSIAVLLFINMSGDPEREYFVDGLVEVTALSNAGRLNRASQIFGWRFRELGPAISDVVFGILCGHFDCAVFPDSQMLTRVCLHRSDAMRRAKANPRAFGRLQLRHLLAKRFEAPQLFICGLSISKAPLQASTSSSWARSDSGA